MSPCCPPVKVTDPPIPLGEVHGLKCQGVAVTSDKLKPMKDGRNKASQAGGIFEFDLKRIDADVISVNQIDKPD